MSHFSLYFLNGIAYNIGDVKNSDNISKTLEIIENFIA